MGLFEPEITPLVWHRPGWLAGSTLYTLERLRAELPLAQRTANMYGKTVAVPRLECWFGQRSYAFGGRVEHPHEPTPSILPLMLLATEAAHELGAISADGPAGQAFDSVFCNLYRDGEDTIPWHADDEPWIGPVIASLSFGAARRFVMKHNATGAKVEYALGDGDLLVMGAGVQREWKHMVPRTAAPVGPRLNLTFRQTVEVRR